MLFMKMSASPIIFFAMARPSGSFRLSDTQFLLVLFKSMVGSSVSVSSQPKPGPWVPLGIAGEGLDLDDLGAHLGQDADGGRGGHVGAHLDDLDAGERAVTVELLGDCHRSISPFMQVVGRAVRLFASLSSQGKEPLSTDKMKYVCKTDSKLSRKYH